MPRKSRSYDKHVPLPDPKYGSVKYAKFINYIMERGKKNVARRIFYTALDIAVGEKAWAGCSVHLLQFQLRLNHLRRKRRRR